MRKELVFIVGLFLFGSTAVAFAQSTRNIEVRVLDETGRPLADAQVILQPVAIPMTQAIERTSFGAARSVRKIIGRATTNAEGLAAIDISTEEAIKADELVAATAWKRGYAPYSANILKGGELRCSRVRVRSMQVLDAEGKPVAGLKVTRDVASLNAESLGATERELFDPPWWTTDEYVTNEFGLVTVECRFRGVQGGSIFEKDGTRHRFSISDINSRMAARLPDDRELTIVHLVRHGKLQGQLPAGTSQDYSVRMQKENKNSLSSVVARMEENPTTLLAEVRTTDEGQFTFDALEEGDYSLIAYRKTPYDGFVDAPLQRQPVAFNRVHIEAGKTASIQIGSEPLAKVSGRIVSDEMPTDLQGKTILLSKKIIVDARNGQFHPLVQAVCAADGSFVAWLPPGTFQAVPPAIDGYRSSPVPEFEIGVGAASFTLDSISLVKTKTLKVAWPGKPQIPSLGSPLSSSVFFQLKDNSRADCVLSADGYGKLEIPVGAEVANIYLDPSTVGTATESAFIDRDDSENFDLELNTKAKGVSAVVGVRGKVVDSNNQPLAGVPVNITLTFEPVASNVNNPTASSFMGTLGSQMIDLVLTQHDGTFQVPPRQLLRRLTIPGRENQNECKFIFSASTLVNPDAIEVRKTFQFKPSEWSESQVELPDLVIDRPMGGNRFSGKLLNAEGQPSAGELIRLNDKRHIVRALTDADGNFSFEDVAGPTWLLRQKDWSIRAISDYSQPMVFKFNSKGPNQQSGRAEPAGWKRPDLNQRRALAKKVLQGVVNAQPSGLPEEAYLEPDQYFQGTLLRGGPNFDDARLQFANFWTELKDEQLVQLSEAASKSTYKSTFLRMLANRKPSAEAYQRAMDALELPEVDNFPADAMINEIAEVGLKLHTFGVLGPYRGKLQQFIDYWTTQKNKERAQLRLPANLPANAQRMWMMDSDSVLMCRALMNPEEFAANATEQLQSDLNELSPEDRATAVRNTSILMRLYPVEQLKLPAERMSASLEYFVDLGTLDPLAGLEAARRGTFSADSVRMIVQSAFSSGHPDAQRAFTESIPLMLQADSDLRRFAFSMGRPGELGWYKAVHGASDELGRIAAWILAFDYLNGKYDDAAARLLPMMERRSQNMLAIAYSIINEYPELCKQIVDRAAPRLLQQAEAEFDMPFARSSDVSLAAYFDAEGTVDVLLKLQKRLDEEMKNQPARQTNSRLYSRRNSLSTLRATCLRGLLLDEQ